MIVSIVHSMGVAKIFEGTIHGVMAMVAFWLFPLALLALSRSIKSPRWSRFYRYTLETFVLAAKRTKKSL